MNSTFSPGLVLQHFVGELAAVQAGHDHVGEQQVERMAGLDDRQRFGRVRRIQRDVAERMQLRQHIVAHQLVVFDDQDGFVAALDRLARASARLPAMFRWPAAGTS